MVELTFIPKCCGSRVCVLIHFTKWPFYKCKHKNKEKRKAKLLPWHSYCHHYFSGVHHLVFRLGIASHVLSHILSALHSARLNLKALVYTVLYLTFWHRPVEISSAILKCAHVWRCKRLNTSHSDLWQWDVGAVEKYFPLLSLQWQM